MSQENYDVPRRALSLSDYNREMDRLFPERELNNSGSYFQDALGSSEDESDDYEDNVIEEAETEAIAPPVFVSPKPRFTISQPLAPVAESNETNPALPIEVTDPSMVSTNIINDEIPKYPSLNDSASSAPESAIEPVENQHGTSNTWFSWLGSFFGSTQSSTSPKSTPSPQSDSSASDTTEVKIKETISPGSPKKSAPVAGTTSKPQNATVSSPVTSVASSQQPQTVNYFIFSGNSGDMSSLPSQMQALFESALGRPQHQPALHPPVNSSSAP